MPSAYELKQQGKQTHDLRHCDDPGCTVGTLIGRCYRCGFVAEIWTECPATKDYVDDGKPWAFRVDPKPTIIICDEPKKR